MTLDDFDLENHFVASCSLGRLFALLQGQLTVAPAINRFSYPSSFCGCFHNRLVPKFLQILTQSDRIE